MIPIKIDVSDFAKKFDFTTQEIRPLVVNTLNALAIRTVELWREEAKSLGSTRNEYLNAIYTLKDGENAVIVGLHGKLPNMLEKGASPFDMKSGFEKSAKRTRTATGGWYLTIPYKWYTPDTVEESTPKIPADIHKAVKSITERRGIAVSELPSKYQGVLGKRQRIETATKVWDTYTHKSTLWEGMVRSPKNNHSHYVTFRRVSDNSDPNSWIHKGFMARNFLDRALTRLEVNSIVLRSRDNFLKEMGF
jgi:hypothetical protein